MYMIKETALPWVECNSLSYVDKVVQGLKLWSRVTDAAIVTTRPEILHEVYSQVVGHGIKIIGGFKTSTIIPGVTAYDPMNYYDFARRAAWEEIAELSQVVVSETGHNICVFENEGALRQFHEGRDDIHLGRLTFALVELKKYDTQYWWNLPSVVDDHLILFPNRREVTAKLTKVVADTVPNSVFFCGAGMYKNWRSNPLNVALRDQLYDMLGEDRVMDRMLLTAGLDNRRYFASEAAIEHWFSFGRRPITMYPGLLEWVSTAEKFMEKVC